GLTMRLSEMKEPGSPEHEYMMHCGEWDRNDTERPIGTCSSLQRRSPSQAGCPILSACAKSLPRLQQDRGHVIRPPRFTGGGDEVAAFFVDGLEGFERRVDLLGSEHAVEAVAAQQDQHAG